MTLKDATRQIMKSVINTFQCVTCVVVWCSSYDMDMFSGVWHTVMDVYICSIRILRQENISIRLEEIMWSKWHHNKNGHCLLSMKNYGTARLNLNSDVNLVVCTCLSCWVRLIFTISHAENGVNSQVLTALTWKNMWRQLYFHVDGIIRPTWLVNIMIRVPESLTQWRLYLNN